MSWVGSKTWFINQDRIDRANYLGGYQRGQELRDQATKHQVNQLAIKLSKSAEHYDMELFDGLKNYRKKYE